MRRSPFCRVGWANPPVIFFVGVKKKGDILVYSEQSVNFDTQKVFNAILFSATIESPPRKSEHRNTQWDAPINGADLNRGVFGLW